MFTFSTFIFGITEKYVYIDLLDILAILEY